MDCAIPSLGKGRKGFLDDFIIVETPPFHFTSDRTPPEGGNFMVLAK